LKVVGVVCVGYVLKNEVWKQQWGSFTLFSQTD
jgi:hypothetical protein